MSTTEHKLTNLTERRLEVQRELSDIAESKSGSGNTALADLAAALTGELARIDQQIQQLQAYLDHVRVDSEIGPNS